MTSKVCKICGVEKLLEDFPVHKFSRHGRRTMCKVCYNVWQRAYYRYRRNENPNYSVANRLRTVYGITLDDYNDMLVQQDGRCAICGTDYPGLKKRFAVDHSHVTGFVRALLCEKCNRGLGLLGDDPERLEAAARYLRAFKKE